MMSLLVHEMAVLKIKKMWLWLCRGPMVSELYRNDSFLLFHRINPGAKRAYLQP